MNSPTTAHLRQRVREINDAYLPDHANEWVRALVELARECEVPFGELLAFVADERHDNPRGLTITLNRKGIRI